MSAGHVSVLPAGLAMRWEWTGPTQSLHVSVEPAVADVLAAERLGRMGVEVPESFSLDDPFVRHLLQWLRMGAVGGVDPLRAEHVIQRLLLRVGIRSRSPARPPSGALSPRSVDMVTEWIEDHLAQPMSVVELAALAGVEASWFTRLFGRAVGCSPYRYVLERRVLRAQTALRAGVSITVAAPMCGFVDQAHLSRHFRRLVGTTPAAWARTART